MHWGIIFGMWMLVSYVFRPKASVYSRKAAVDSAFVNPLYRGGIGVDYRVFHIAASCVFTACFHRCFYSRSAYLAINIVNVYLCWWPLILYCCCGALLV